MEDKRLEELLGKVNYIFDVLQAGLQKQQPVRDVAFDAWLSEWFERYKRPVLKDSSIRQDERYIRYLTQAFGDVSLCKLNGNDIQDYLLTIEQGNTRKKIFTILNETLEKACQLGYLFRNPCRAVELPTHRVRHYRPLQFVEQNTLLREEKNELYGNVFLFLCCTGMRVGEFLALDLNTDIDYGRNEMSVSQSLDRDTGKIVSPKTESGNRRFPFDVSLLPCVLYKKEYFQRGGMLTYSEKRQHFVRLYNRLGITGANLHSFRHTFVSVCHMENIPVKYIQRIVGHSKIEMTLNVYTHELSAGTSFVREYVKKLKKILLG